MKIAIISDTHDHKDNIIKAVSIMNEKKVEALIHCGDIVSPFVKRWFDDLNQTAKNNFFGVFGNNDGEKIHLKRVLGQICQFAENGLEHVLELGGKKIFVSHYPKPETIKALADSSNFDMILTGHTHELINDQKPNGVLVLNPGEVCGYLTGKATFAIVDTLEMKVEIINL
ncbi:MAG: metallophosphoesterase [Candidatus Lokiarchaeota archaeon]|nr:metallophosphoesterase [Candidatus Lokiarchaeota archaeon]